MRSLARQPDFLIWTFLLSITLIFVQPETVESQNGLPASTSKDLEELIKSAMERTPLPGLAIAIVIDGKPHYSKGFGYADVDTKKEITTETIFQIGSITKSFTATLAAQLVEEGEISWSDDLAKYFPNAKVPDKRITLQHLAQHTSGLPGDPPNLRRKHGDYPILAFTHFELYQGLKQSTLQFQPGKQWSYSNFGYAVLGHTLEIKTNTPFEVLVEQKLFNPLKMNSSTVTIWPELKPRLAKPYHLVDRKLADYDSPWDEEALAPAGGIASTSGDIAKYVAFQIKAHEKSNAVGDLQKAEVTTRGNPYGKGWFVEQIPGVGKVVSVGGDVDGYVGEIVFAPEHGIGSVILINSGDAPALPYVGRWAVTTLCKTKSEIAATEAIYYRAMIAQSLGNWSAAIASFSKLAKRSPPHVLSLYQIGRTAAMSGDYSEEGILALTRYTQHKPAPGISHAAAYWRLGMINNNEGKIQLAINAYKKAIEMEPDFVPAIRALREIEK